MLQLNPYLHFMGNAFEAMNFYKTVFGGQFSICSRYNELPGGEKMDEEDGQKYIHISLPLKNGQVLMASDTIAAMGKNRTFGDNQHICIDTESEAEADHLFELLADGGEVEMPMNKTFFGAYFGMCKDKFEIQWMLNYSATNQK